MTIAYTTGDVTEAALLSRTDDSLRVAIPGRDDAAEFHRVNGVWVSEDLDPVQLEFAWSRCAEPPVPAIENCICPPELAAELVRKLFSLELEQTPNVLLNVSSYAAMTMQIV